MIRESSAFLSTVVGVWASSTRSPFPYERLREYAQDHGKLVSARALQLAQWTILVTNVPVWMLTHEQACVLMRARGQIELEGVS